MEIPQCILFNMIVQKCKISVSKKHRSYLYSSLRYKEINFYTAIKTKLKENFMIFAIHTIVNPWAMMIHFTYTHITNTAMMGS